MDLRGRNFYIDMNPLRSAAKSRTKSDTADVRRIYLNLDHDGDSNSCDPPGPSQWLLDF